MYISRSQCLLHIRQEEKKRDPALFGLSESPAGRRVLQQMTKISDESTREQKSSNNENDSLEKIPSYNKIVSYNKSAKNGLPLSSTAIVKICWLRLLPNKVGITLCEMIDLEDCFHLIQVIFSHTRIHKNLTSCA